MLDPLDPNSLARTLIPTALELNPGINARTNRLAVGTREAEAEREAK